MYDKLLSLPLFQGLGHNDLTRIIESTHLSFETAAPDTTLIQQDELCKAVLFVMDGKTESITASADRSWRVAEHLPTPQMIGLYELYGSTRTFQCSCTSLSTVHILEVDKRTIAALTGYFEVFRINVLNTLSTAIARQLQPMWLPASSTLEGRIVHFLRTHVQRPAGYKRFEMSLRTIGQYLGEDYRYVSRALHALQERQLIRLERRCIEIPSIEKLIQEIV